MKTALSFLKITVLMLLLAGCAATAKTPVQNTALEQAIQNKQFVFDAQTVLPTGGTIRRVTGQGYELRVHSDSLHAELPYFGSVYTASINGEGGYRFNSTSFDYSIKPKKHGGWEISIKPKGAEVREFVLSVSPDGYATLQAMSNNRQPISYNGQVQALP